MNIYWLDTQHWWAYGANIIQWATVIGWGVLFHHFWVNRCREPLCVRHGVVPVSGTVHKMCKRHAAKHNLTH